MRAREAVAREDKELTSDGVVASVEKPGRATPSGDLNAMFLVELSVALHRYSMYPSDHPSIGPSIEGVVRRASALLKDRPSIALGVARRQLIIDGVARSCALRRLRRKCAQQNWRWAAGYVRYVDNRSLPRTPAKAVPSKCRRTSAPREVAIPINRSYDGWPRASMATISARSASCEGCRSARWPKPCSPWPASRCVTGRSD